MRFLIIAVLLGCNIGATRPSLTVKPADIERARENQKRYKWARDYVAATTRRATDRVEQLTPAFIEQMLEPTTPISTIFTPCPACRDQGKTWHPHGQWTWSDQAPEQ